MKNVWLASYKGAHSEWHLQLGAEFVRAMCDGIYSHNEIVIGDHPFEEVCRCISASAMDGGVREKQMRLNPQKWDIIKVQADIERIGWWVDVNNGGSYDYWGAVAVRLPFLAREHPSKWFCSEACASMLEYDEAWRLDPCALHAVIASFEKQAQEKNL